MGTISVATIHDTNEDVVNHTSYEFQTIIIYLEMTKHTKPSSA